ncbi:hypothetical protein [Porphyromonas phage phage019b_ATCC49417]|uniref:Uncharacterized protein n=1 Tax=Porphyromonas phage phage019a_ATCC49417 TaxID=3154109 RepID=A0AAT9JKE0_9VIRU
MLPSYDNRLTSLSTSRAGAHHKREKDLYPSSGYTSQRAMADISITR